MPSSAIVDVAGEDRRDRCEHGVHAVHHDAGELRRLSMRSPAKEIAADGRRRAKGATLIVVTAHIGTRREKYDVPS